MNIMTNNDINNLDIKLDIKEEKICKDLSIWLNAYKRTKKDLDNYNKEKETIVSNMVSEYSKQNEESYQELCDVIENCVKMIQTTKQNLERLYYKHVGNYKINDMIIFDEISQILESG